jgi:SEC-C motif-containing protein
MRSRYSAYVTVSVDYLLRTTHPSVRKYYSAKAIRAWAEENTWLKLEITRVATNTVTFSAHYLNAQGIPEIHREHSTFRQEKGTWYFLEGEDPGNSL